MKNRKALVVIAAFLLAGCSDSEVKQLTDHNEKLKKELQDRTEAIEGLQSEKETIENERAALNARLDIKERELATQKNEGGRLVAENRLQMEKFGALQKALSQTSTPLRIDKDLVPPETDPQPPEQAQAEDQPQTPPETPSEAPSNP